MRRRLGAGLLVAGACSACWIAPLVVAALGGGWTGALGGGWAWIVAVAAATGASLVLLRRLHRRRGCGCPPAP